VSSEQRKAGDRVERRLETVVAVDLGTTRVKFGLLSRAGDIQLVHAAPAPVHRSEAYAAVQDPAELVEITLDGLSRCALATSAPRAVVFTGQMGGAVTVDATGTAVSPWVTAMDMRCAAARESPHRDVRERVRELSACAPFQAERLRWLVEDDPSLGEAALALLIAPYVALRLADEGIKAAFIDRTSLCWTGMADTARAMWDNRLALAAGWSASQLPRIVEPGTTVGGLSVSAAARTGLPRGLPIIAGPGDQPASLYALGARERGQTIDIAATFPILLGVTTRYEVPARPRIELMPSVFPDVWHPLGYLLGSGSAMSWFAEQIAGLPMAKLEREATEAGHSGGLVAIPYGGGEAGTGFRGAFVGLTGGHNRGQLYRALLEGLACEYALLAEEFAAEGIRVRAPVVSVGGGSGSALLEGLKASVLGMAFRRLPAIETTLLGAALVAARELGWDMVPSLPVVELVEPDPTCRPEELLARYRKVRAAFTAEMAAEF
jgi:xylulokinase